VVDVLLQGLDYLGQLVPVPGTRIRSRVFVPANAEAQSDKVKRVATAAITIFLLFMVTSSFER
jgi:hypothetical protein